MADDGRSTQPDGRKADLNMCAWYNPDTGHIHLTMPSAGWFNTIVAADAKSKLGHPILYWKLAKALREAGLPAPASGDKSV